jgi:hypothetical protein
MKKNLFLTLFFCLVTLVGLYGQSANKSLNYQAVILDPKSIDIPGASLTGQPLSKGKVCLKFTLLNLEGNVDYEEFQETTTDEYGLVSLSVGKGTFIAGTYKNFQSIVWDANMKSMKVAVSYDGCNSFKQVSTQVLNFTPYALYAEAVDYKNVRDTPTKVSQFSNDTGYLIPKDLDPLKADININSADIKSNTSQIALANQTIADNKKSSEDAFLIVNQNIKSIDVKVADNTADIKNNASQIALANQTIADNKKNSEDAFLIVNQSIKSTDIKVADNTADIKNNTSQIALANQTIADNKKNSEDAFLIVNQNIKSTDIKVADNTADIKNNASQIALANQTIADNKKSSEDAFLIVNQSIKSTDIKVANNTADIISNASQIATANQTIADNKKSSEDAFLIVNQSIKNTDLKVAENRTIINDHSSSIGTINAKLNDQQNQISDNRNQISATNNSLNNQIGGLQGQINTTNSNLSDLSGTAEVVSNKSISITLGGANPSDQLYPSQKAAKAYVDNAIYDAVGTGVADATTLAPGKVQLAGDLGGTATSPTVPALANKENSSNKSTSVQTDASSDSKYPSVKAVKDYVDQATTGIALQATVDGKADKNSPTFTGTPVLPTRTIAVTQSANDNSTKLATTAFVQQATAAGIIDASSSTKGKLKLSGDLGGTADSPTVPGLATKANISDVNTSLSSKEDASNKSTATALGSSDVLYPSQKAVKIYVDSQIASATIADADASTKGKIQLAGDLSGTASFPTVPGLATKADTSSVNTALALKANASDVSSSLAAKADTSSVNSALALKANASDVSSSLAAKADTSSVNPALALKAPLASPTFTGTPSLPTGTTGVTQAAGDNSTKLATTFYVDRSIAAGAPDATNTTLGKIRLSGDLAGTADDPTVPGLSLKADTSSVNSALALKANASDVSSSLAAKADTNSVNTALALKANSSDVTISLATKADTSSVNSALALKANSSDVSSSLAAKADTSSVNSALALKANSSDVSSSLAAKADTSSVNSALALKANSTDVSSSLAAKADTRSVNTALALKANASDVSNSLATKADTSSVNSALALKANSADVSNSLAAKADTSSVYSALALKANSTDVSSSLAAKADTSAVNTALALKAPLASVVPYTGANQAVDLGVYDLKVNGITVGKGGGSDSTNTAIGLNALKDNTTIGIYNTASGTYALKTNTTGGGNTASGAVALLYNTTGSNNTAIGVGTLSSNITGENNTAIGTNANVGSDALFNATAIGYDAVVNTSNTIQLGNTAVTNVNTSGTIIAAGMGLGVSAPNASAALDVNSTTKGFLPPRMTTSQRDSISTPEAGLTIWNTTNKQLEVYDGSYWKNMIGLLVSTLRVGDTYGGGKIFYIFDTSDNGYVKGQTHGLIAATEDQTTDAGIKWFPEKYYGATGTYIGLGLPNTLSIILSAVLTGTTNLKSFAAGLANSYRGGGYMDWYLPSRDELNLLYQNKDAVGGFATTGHATYWSSTQKGTLSFTKFEDFAKGVTAARTQFFFTTTGPDGKAAGTQSDLGIDNPRRVRAIRIF